MSLNKSFLGLRWMDNIRIALILLGFLVGGLAYGQNPIGDPDDIVFKCEPCNLTCDTIKHKLPGRCEYCFKPMFATYKWLKQPSKIQNNSLKKTVAVLLFPGVEVIDFAGPYEVFEAAGAKVFTVAESTDVLTSGLSLKIEPNYSFENMPHADIVVVPGGDVNSDNSVILDWLKKQDKQAETIISVCNGAFYLSSAGMLDGLTATTFFTAIPSLKSTSPKTKVVDDQRYVDNGHIVTSAGLSSGLDAALFVVSKYLGMGRTEQIATTLEYKWNRDNDYVRAQLADKHVASLPDVFYSFPRKILRYAGDANQWQIDVNIQTDLTEEQIRRLVVVHLERVCHWKKSTSVSNTWEFEDQTNIWSCALAIANGEQAGGEKKVSVNVKRSTRR